jgi:hypothetical protein
MRKITYSAWSVEMNKWLVKMRSLFRVVKPGISSPVLLPRPKGGAGRPRLFDKDFQPGQAEVSPGVLSRKSIKPQLNQYHMTEGEELGSNLLHVCQRSRSRPKQNRGSPYLSAPLIPTGQ